MCPCIRKYSWSRVYDTDSESFCVKEFTYDSEYKEFIDLSCGAQEKMDSPEAHLDTCELKNMVTPIKAQVYLYQRIVT